MDSTHIGYINLSERIKEEGRKALDPS